MNEIEELKYKLKVIKEFIEFISSNECSSKDCKLENRTYEKCLNCITNEASEVKSIINSIEDIIKPYQEEFEKEALSLPGAIESILERYKGYKHEIKYLKNKLQIAKSALQYYVDGKIPDNWYVTDEFNNKFTIIYDRNIAYDALEQIKDIQL